MPGLAKIAGFGLVLVVWFFAHYYVYFRLKRLLRPGRFGRVGLACLLGMLGLAYLIGRGAVRFADTSAFQALVVTGAVWMGYLGILYVALIPIEAVLVLPAWIASKRRRVTGAFVTRMLNVSFAVAFAAAIVLAGVGYFVSALPVAVRSAEVRMAGLPPSMDGFRIMFLSDIHVGGLVDDAVLSRIERAVRSEKADLLVFGGDMTDEEDGGDGSAFARMASWGKPGRVFGVSGNHEKYVGGERVLTKAETAGIRILRQNAVKIDDGFWLAGVDDPALLPRGTGPERAIDRALDGLPGGEPVVLVSHQPVAVQHAAGRGLDLMLCGHTHHGQTPPASLFTPLMYRFFAGRYDVGGMVAYVTSGAGFWGPPLRLGTRSEVVVITLKSQGAGGVEPN